MNKVVILTLSLLSVPCAQARQKPNQNFSPESHARKNNKESTFSNWFKNDPNLRVEIEESPEHMRQGISQARKSCKRVSQVRKDGKGYYFVADEYYQARLINKYIERCLLKYDKRSDAKQCSASAILDIAVRMKQAGFETNICDIALDKFNK